jgi:hypothetical protein
MRVFEVQADLEEAVSLLATTCAHSPMQPVIYTHEAGERQVKMMRWANYRTGCSSTPTQRVLARQASGKMRFSRTRGLCQAMPSLSGRRYPELCTNGKLDGFLGNPVCSSKIRNR